MTSIAPYVEKYRPSTFEEVIGIEDLDKIKESCQNLSSMPNLLFEGPAGIGKTTIAKIIIKQHQPVDVLKTHGKNVNIDWIRENLIPFASSMSSQPGKRKIVFIDEFDGITIASMDDLRATIEKYFKNIVFICTCNFLNKISEPVQSRFSIYKFKKPKAAEVIERLKMICEQENIIFEKDCLETIYQRSRGDIRQSINTLQKLGASIKLSYVKNIGTTAVSIIKLIQSKDWKTLRLEKCFEISDYESILGEIDDILFGSNLPDDKKRLCNEIIAEGLEPMSRVFRKDIQFCAVCSKLMGVI